MALRRLAGPWFLLAAVPARAECLGACAKDMEAAVLSILAYGVIGIALLVMLIRARWRRAGFWAAGLVLLLAVGVPLVSQAWHDRTLRGVKAREVVGVPPRLATRVPLLITPDEYCTDTACEAVVQGMGAAGVHVLTTGELDGVDLTRPIALTDLPLAHWVQSGPGGEMQQRELTAADRRDAAGRIDYLVVTAWPYNPAEPGPVEAALSANPALDGMGAGVAVRLLMAPVKPGQGLALTSVQPDLLDLSLLDRALAVPLAPRNWQNAGNRAVGVEAAARAICPADDPGGACVSLLER